MWGTSVTIRIGLVMACLLCGSTNANASPSQSMTQPSRIPPVLFFKLEEFLIYLYI